MILSSKLSTGAGNVKNPRLLHPQVPPDVAEVVGGGGNLEMFGNFKSELITQNTPLPPELEFLMKDLETLDLTNQE